MALMKCNECGHPVSDKADCCPKCGNPINDKASNVQSVNNVPSQRSMMIQRIFGGIIILHSAFLGYMMVKDNVWWPFVMMFIGEIAFSYFLFRIRWRIGLCVWGLSMFLFVVSLAMKSEKDFDEIEATHEVRNNSIESLSDIDISNKEQQKNELSRKGNWIYKNNTDPMTDEVIYLANCTSDNVAIVCDERTHLHLGLVFSDTTSKILLALEKGRFRQEKLPQAYLRFDKGEVIECSVYNDGERVIYLFNYDEIIDKLKTSEHLSVRIETEDFRTADFDFSIKGLVWNHPKMKD